MYEDDPATADKAILEGIKAAAADAALAIETMIASMGYKRGSPEERKAGYTFKTRFQPMLWVMQKMEYPKRYEKAVKDAYSLGADLPPAMQRDAVAYGAKWHPEVTLGREMPALRLVGGTEARAY